MALALAPSQTVPIHWNLAGQVDGSANKWVALALAAGLYVFLLILPRIDPGRPNYAQFTTVYGVIRLAVLAALVH